MGSSWLQVERSWGHLSSKLGDLGSKLGHPGSKLGVKLALKLNFGTSSQNHQKSMIFIVFLMFLWGRRFQLGAMLRHLGIMLGHLGSKLGVLEPSWIQVGRSWGHLGSKLEVLGPSWLQVGGSWCHLGSKLRVQCENTEKSLVFYGFWGGPDAKCRGVVVVIGWFLPCPPRAVNY